MNVRDLMERSRRAFGGHIAVAAESRAFSFDECWSRGVRLARGLMARGVKPGDHVAVLEMNTIWSVDFYIASAIAGFVRVPLYWRNAVSVHLSMIENAQSRFIVVDDEVGDAVVSEIVDAVGERNVMVRGAAFERWLENQDDIDPAVRIDENWLSMIRHSGGTTGRPKGITSTQRQWACIGRDEVAFKPLIAPGDSMLHVAPMSHASGYYFLPAWAAGARQVLSPSTAPDRIVELLRSEEIQYLFAPPTLLDSITAVAGSLDIPRLALKCLAIGSAPISRRVIQAARDCFGDDVLYQTYGTSEAVPISGMGPKEWFMECDDAEPLLSAGRPLPLVDLELRDEGGKTVPVGEIGEVTVRCDGMADGYYNAPEQTRESFVDGWFRTGDLGRLDKRGYLHLVDRVGEMIISGGHNIYPADLERIVGQVEGVLEVAVFGIPHEKWGETPIVLCQASPDASVSSEKVREYVARELGSYMKPTDVMIRTEKLPRTAVGKISRRAARDVYLSQREPE
ncbi:MAG: acyl--CoA ligase [Betaproteobacteria bacterium]|nr:acyl--CoA ligase [Betaproteobacteria bacterium]